MATTAFQTAKAASRPQTATRTRSIVVALFVLALVPLFTTPVLPFIDLYNHLARYFVLAHLDSSEALRANYASNWSILPNIGLDVLGTMTLRVLPPQYAAHVTVAAIFAIQYSGVLYFNRQLAGRTSVLVALLLVPLLYSFILNWGFANFLFGLGLSFWGAGWWLAKRDRLAAALPGGCAFAVAIFLTHGLAFALYGILVAALEIGIWLERPLRTLAGLARALVPVAAQAVLPVALFVLAATSRSTTGLTTADESVARLAAAGHLAARLIELCLYRLTTIVRVEEGPNLWFDAATFVVQLAIAGGLVASGRVRIARAAWPAIGVAALLVAFMPPAILGVGYVADRMPLFMALLVVGALVPAVPLDRTGRICTAVLAAIVAVRLVATGIGWQGYTRDHAEFESLAALIPPGALVVDTVVDGNRHDDAPRCQMYRPLLISTHGIIGPLFANETQQPLRLTGPLRAALDNVGRLVPRDSARADDTGPLAAAAGPAGFDYLLICHAKPLARLPGAAPIADTPRFTLLKLRR